MSKWAVGQKRSGGELVAEASVDEHSTKVYEGDGSEARVQVSRTYNLGNYESLRIEVGITLPGEAATIKQRIDEAKEIVTGKLREFLEEAGVG